jgi:hypothetical protein
VSEPIFEASVRLRADVSNFEQQAQASLKTTTDRLEQQAKQAAASGQKAVTVPVAVAPVGPQLEAQVASAQATAIQKPLVVPVEVKPEATGGTGVSPLNALIEEATAAKARLSETRGELSTVEKQLAQFRSIQASSLASGGPLAESFGRSTMAQDIPVLEQRSAELRRQVFFEGELANAAQARARAQLKADQEAALSAATAPASAPGAPGGGGGGIFDSITGPGGILRSRSGTSSLAGILGTTARFGLAGLAFGAAFSGLSELQNALRATGDEAFTTQGKIRNLGSELLSGNLIGGIKAVLAQKPADFDQPLQDALAQLEATKKAAAETTISAQQLVNLQGTPNRPQDSERNTGYERYKVNVEGASDALENFLAKEVQEGHISKERARELAKVAPELTKQAQATLDAAAATDAYSAALERAGGSAAKLFGPEGFGGARGPGGIPTPQFDSSIPAGTVIGRQTTGIPRDIIQPDLSTFTQGTGGTEVGNQIRDSITSRIQNDQLRLQAEVKNARIIQDQKRETFEAARGTQQVGAAWSDFVAATTVVRNKVAEARAAGQANTEAIQAAGSRARDAQAAQIADPTARLNAQLANAQKDEATAAATLAQAKKANKSARDIAEANATYQEAVAARAGIEQQISDNTKAAAQAAADDAQNAHELRLANNIAAAALTARKSDDKKFYNEAIDYYRTLSRDSSRTATEREQARGQVTTLKQGLKEALSGGGGDELQLAQLQHQLAQAQQVGSIPLQRRAAKRLVDFWEGQVKDATGVEKAQAQASLIGARGQLKAVDQSAVDLRQQRIQNRVAAAQLTEGLGDDKRAADDLVKFWQNQVKHATGVDKETKRASLIAAKLARQSLDKEGEQSGTGIGTIDFLKLSQGIMRDFAGNLLPTGGPEQARSLFEGSGDEGGGGVGDFGGMTSITSSFDIGTGADLTAEAQVEELRQIRRLLERNGTGATVHVNQSFRQPDGTGYAQARYAKLALEDAFNG